MSGEMRSAENDATQDRTRVCYCTGRGDDYHLAGDPGCVARASVIPPAKTGGAA